MSDDGATTTGTKNPKEKEDEHVSTSQAEATDDNLEVLLLRCSPMGEYALPGTKEEIEDIKEIYEKKGARVRALGSGSPKDLLKSLFIGLDVLHISCHMNCTLLGDESLLFVDSRGRQFVISAKHVIELIATRRDSLKLVVLNGCCSKKIAFELAQRGVRCVFGWETKVDDWAAKTFAIGLHEAWIRGESPSVAFEKAKKSVTTEMTETLFDGKRINKYVLMDPDSEKIEKKSDRIVAPKTPELHYRIPAGIPVVYVRNVCADRRCEPPRDLVGRGFVDGLRREDVAAVTEMLVGGDVGARRKVGLHGVNGLGGLGKSTLAQQLCWNVHDIRSVFFNGGMFWLTASEDTSVLGELRKLVRDLYGLHFPEDDVEHVLKRCDSPEKALRAVAHVFMDRWFVKDWAPVLIVLDDVWDAKKVASLVPLDVLPRGSAVLMTYRDRRVGKDARVTSQRALSVLSEDASLKLLRDICGKEAPRKAALKVAKRLGYHPMALKIASRDVVSREEDGDASCDATKSTVWLKYLKDLNDDIEDMTLDDEDKVDDNEARRRHESVFCSIALSLRRLRGTGRKRGRHGALLPTLLRTKYHQLAIFGEDAEISPMALTRVWEFTKASETEACAGVFVQAGLLEKRVDGAEGEYVSYRLHDLCRDYVRWRIEKRGGVDVTSRQCECPSGHRLVVLLSSDHMCDLCKCDIDDVRYHCVSGCDYDVCSQCWEKSPPIVIKASTKEMQRSFVAWLASEDWEETLTSDGDDRSRRVRMREWERTFEAAVGMEVVSRSKAEPSVEGAKVVDEFSRLLSHFGRLVEAKEMAERSLEMLYAIYGTDKTHPSIATSLGRLGEVLQALGDLEEAKTKYEACLKMEYANYGTDEAHPYITTSLNNLGRVLHELGDLEEAKRKFEASLKMTYAIHGTDKAHPEIAKSLCNLGNVLQDLGDLEEAKTTYEACVKMLYAIYGTDKAHPSIAALLGNLGGVLEALGDLEEAKTKYEACLKMRYAIYGTDKAHPEIARSLSDLGEVLQALGDLEEAKTKYEACLKMRYAIYGTDKAHPDITTSLSSLGVVLHELGDLEEAKRKYEACLKMRYAIYGTDKPHSWIAMSLSNLGVVLQDLGDLEEAKRKYEACLKMMYAIYGTDKAHPDIATSLSKFGGILKDFGDLEEAKRKYEACLKMRYAIYGTDKAHPDIARSLNSLGEVLQALGDLDEAKTKYEASLKMNYAIYGADKAHPDIATSLSKFGGIPKDFGDLEEAKKKYETCLKMRYAIYGTDKAHPDIAASLCNLGNLLQDLGDLEEAKTTYEACVKMLYDIYGTDKVHPSIAALLGNLGTMLLDFGDLEEAKTKYEACLKMRYAIYGTDKAHPEIARSLSDLGEVLEALGDLEEAKRKFEASLKMRYAIYGTDKAHPEIATSLCNLGNVLQNLGDLEEAKTTYEASVKMLYAIYGTDKAHPSIAALLGNLGDVHRKLGDLEEAKTKYERV